MDQIGPNLGQIGPQQPILKVETQTAGEENTPEPEESKDYPDGCSARIGNYNSLITQRTRCPNKPKPYK